MPKTTNDLLQKIIKQEKMAAETVQRFLELFF